jgi:hypothetical protein
MHLIDFQYAKCARKMAKAGQPVYFTFIITTTALR